MKLLPFAWILMVVASFLFSGENEAPIKEKPDYDQHHHHSFGIGRSGETVPFYLTHANGIHQELSYELVDGLAVFEGDMVLRLDEDGNVIFPGSVTSSNKAAIQSNASFRWPSKTVPYTFDPALSLPIQTRVAQAIAHIEANTSVRFVSRTNQPDYVTFEAASACAAEVGRQGGQQFVWLGNFCLTREVIHEIGHALGLFHEQSRPDRDAFININWNNIQPHAIHNFETYTARNEDGQMWGPYDYQSIMHYPSFFSEDWVYNISIPTITTIHGANLSQQSSLSQGDINAINYMYPPSVLLTWMNGPNTRAPNQPGLWSVSVANGTPPYKYYWFKSYTNGFEVLGKSSTQVASHPTSFNIICDVVDFEDKFASRFTFVNVNGPTSGPIFE